MIRIPNLHTIHTAIEERDPQLEAVLGAEAAAIPGEVAGTPEVVDRRTAEINAIARHSRLVMQATARRKRYRVQSALDQGTTLLDDANARERAVAARLDTAPDGSLVGGAILIAAAAVLLLVEYFLVVSVVPPALGLRPGSLPAIAMAAVAPLAMVALEPFVDRIIVGPFTHRGTLGRPVRVLVWILILAAGVVVAVFALAVVTANAELRQEYSRVLIDLMKHKQGAELPPASVRASVRAIGVLALIAAPLLCSFGHHSLIAGYRRWRMLREQRDLKQLALAASLRLADSRSQSALLGEQDAARDEAESYEAVIGTRALRGLAETAAAAEIAARTRAAAAEAARQSPASEPSHPDLSTDRQLYEQILRRRREVLDAAQRKAS